MHFMSGLFMDLGKLTPSLKIVCTNLLSFFIPVLNNCSILYSVQIISVLKLSGHFPVFSCLNDSLCFLSGFLCLFACFMSDLFALLTDLLCMALSLSIKDFDFFF